MTFGTGSRRQASNGPVGESADVSGGCLRIHKTTAPTLAISRLNTSLHHPLCTLQDGRYRTPCNTRSRLADCAFTGRELDPLACDARFLVHTFLLPELGLAQYEYSPGRSGKHGQKLLEGFSGMVQVDSYGCRAMRKHRAPLAEKNRQDREAGRRGRQDKAALPDCRQGDKPGIDHGPVPQRPGQPGEGPLALPHARARREGIPYGAAPQGNSDTSADYGEFTVLAEVTTTLRLKKSDIARRWDSAHGHVDAVEDVPRICCLMVSGLGLARISHRERRPAKFSNRLGVGGGGFCISV